MSRRRKKFLAIVAVCSAGTLFQTGVMPSGCAEFYGQATLFAFDACSVFNCTGGSYFNLCEPVPLFVDCPNFQATQP